MWTWRSDSAKVSKARRRPSERSAWPTSEGDGHGGAIHHLYQLHELPVALDDVPRNMGQVLHAQHSPCLLRHLAAPGEEVRQVLYRLPSHALGRLCRRDGWAVDGSWVDHDGTRSDVVGKAEGGLQLRQVLGAALPVVGRRGNPSMDEVDGEVDAIGGCQHAEPTDLRGRDGLRPERPRAQLQPPEPVLDCELDPALRRALRA